MSTRGEVASEAARLIYYNKVKEYKDAKDMAASSLNTKELPSNYEVALELDRIVEDSEGSDRLNMLIEMRKIALEVMKKIKEYNPLLIGSVWRGTSRKGSDIDIIIYSEDLRKVKKQLKDYEIISIDSTEFNLRKVSLSSFHINLDIKDHPVEIIVRSPNDRDFYKNEKCETYGDIKRGMNIQNLEKLIEVDPLRRFIPKRRNR